MAATPSPGEDERRRAVAVAGHLGDEAIARAALSDPSPAVRSAALGALQRGRRLRLADLLEALGDGSPVVRRRGCELAVKFSQSGSFAAVVGLINDSSASVAEAACWSAGELASLSQDQDAVGSCVQALSTTAGSHPDPLVREAAVAALGAAGHIAGLRQVLLALRDKPAVRRRAVIALAAFEGAEVDEALVRASNDTDWQVRQAAEDLLGRGNRPSS